MRRRALQRVNGEKDNLAKENEENKRYIAKLECKLATIGPDVHEKQSANVKRIQELKEQLNTKAYKLAEAEATCRAQEDETANLRRALDLRASELQSEYGGSDINTSLLYGIAQCKKEKEDLSLKIDQQGQTLKEAEQRAESYGTKLMSMRNEKEAAAKEAQEVRAERDELERELEDAREGASGAETLRNERDEAQSQLNQMRERARELQHELQREQAARERETKRLQDEVRRLREEREGASNEAKRRWESEVSVLRSELEASKQEVQHYQSAAEEERKRFESAEERRREAVERAENLEAHVDNLTEQIERIKSELASEQDKSKAFQLERDQRVVEVERLREEESRLQEAFKSLQRSQRALNDRFRWQLGEIEQALEHDRAIGGELAESISNHRQGASSLANLLSREEEMSHEAIDQGDLSAFRDALERSARQVEQFLSPEPSDSPAPPSPHGHHGDRSQLEQLAEDIGIDTTSQTTATHDHSSL